MDLGFQFPCPPSRYVVPCLFFKYQDVLERAEAEATPLLREQGASQETPGRRLVGRPEGTGTGQPPDVSLSLCLSTFLS